MVQYRMRVDIALTGSGQQIPRSATTVAKPKQETSDYNPNQSMVSAMQDS